MPKEIKPCKYCGELFSSYEVYRTKFCSHICSTDYKLKQSLKVCPNCNIEFETVRRGQKYCSRDCFFAYDHKRALIVCPVCSRKFKRKSSRQRFCSRECMVLGRKKKVKHPHHDCPACKAPVYHSQHKYCSVDCYKKVLEGRKLPDLKCVHCGKSFPHRSCNGVLKKYCSRDCAAAGRTGKKLVTLTCDHCGVVFQRKRNKIKGKLTFCTHKCCREYMKENFSKGKSRSEIPPKLRFEVLKRDGFKCVYCGGNPLKNELHIDHIMPQSLGGSNDKENLATSCSICNMGKSDMLLSELPEGVTLQ